MTPVEVADADALFAEFVASHGASVARAYSTGLARRPGETLWRWDCGWGGICEVSPGLWSYRAGIFKGHERKGYRKVIRRWLAEQAFAAGADALRTSVRLDNPHQVASMLRSALDGTWMELSAVEDDKLVFYMTREKWETLR